MIIVAVAKQENYNLEEVKSKLSKILTDSGILNLIKGKKILIKPNCTGLFRPEKGRTTHPKILEALIELIKNWCKSITIGESSSVGVDTKEAYKITGMYDVAQKLGIRIIDFKKSEYQKIKIKNGLVLREISVPKEILEADYIISLAKMKTNYVSQISCSMKNMKGILKDSEKKKFHKLNLSGAVADLNNCFNNVIAIVDGILGSELYEPIRGNVLIASRNAVACDYVCARIIGINPASIGHIELARKAKKLEKIKLIGQIPRKKFKTSPPNLRALEKKFKIKIIDGKPCSSCIGALYLCLKKTKQQAPELLKNLKIIIGNCQKADNCVRFGNCAAEKGKISVYGCTPTSFNFIACLKNRNK